MKILILYLLILQKFQLILYFFIQVLKTFSMLCQKLYFGRILSFDLHKMKHKIDSNTKNIMEQNPDYELKVFTQTSSIYIPIYIKLVKMLATSVILYTIKSLYIPYLTQIQTAMRSCINLYLWVLKVILPSTDSLTLLCSPNTRILKLYKSNCFKIQFPEIIGKSLLDLIAHCDIDR